MTPEETLAFYRDAYTSTLKRADALEAQNTRLYEKEALHTESYGMVCAERDRALNSLAEAEKREAMFEGKRKLLLDAHAEAVREREELRAMEIERTAELQKACADLAGSVPLSTYELAVKGRQDFREAYRREMEYAGQLNEAAERMVRTYRDWMAGCEDNTRAKDVEAAHIHLRDTLAKNPAAAQDAAMGGSINAERRRELNGVRNSEPELECPYCGKDLPDQQTGCCGEVGHAVEKSQSVELPQSKEAP